MKRTERKRKKSKSDTTFEGSEVIDLISDEEVDKTPPRNSMQIKRWKTILETIHSKSQITRWQEGFINRMNKSPNEKKIKLDQGILKVWISFMHNLTIAFSTSLLEIMNQ